MENMENPTLRATRGNVICRPIRQTKQGGLVLPGGARARLPLVRILHAGPDVQGYKEGDVALFLIDPTTVEPGQDFVYGEYTWQGEILWEMPHTTLGGIVDGFEAMATNFEEGVSERQAADMEAKIKDSAPRLVVPKVRH